MAHIGIDARLNAYRTGGISSYTRNLVQALTELPILARISVFYHRQSNEIFTPRFRSRRLWTPPHHRLERLALAVELARHRLDLWHSPDFIPPYRAARRHVITVHDLTFLHYPQYLTADSRRYYNDQIQAAVRQADHILVVSEATRQDLHTLLQVPLAKMTLQPNGVSAAYRPLSATEARPLLQKFNLPERYVLHVGTLEPRKNISGLLAAYRQLRAELPTAPPLVLVGRWGWLVEDLQEEIEQAQAEGWLYWQANVPDDALPAVYSRAVLHVSPSFYEGFGMPTLEAMACGVVPIVSNRSALPEVVGEVGLLVTPEEPDSICRAMRYALEQPDWCATMRANAILRAQNFTWQTAAQIAWDTYQHVLR
jgi:glycosyltransferase involved in cell wall biosynthesis